MFRCAAHWGNVRAAALKPAWGLPQTPLRGFPLRLPSSLRGGFKQLGRNQVSLCFLILVFVRFALENGVTMGLPPHAPLGALPQTPLRGLPPSGSLLRFAAVLRSVCRNREQPPHFTERLLQMTIFLTDDVRAFQRYPAYRGHRLPAQRPYHS